MRVGVLPTGRMELAGLPGALKTLFPAHEFVSIHERLDADRKPVPFDSFTSSGKPLVRGAPNGNVDKIVEQMAAELEPGRDKRPWDLLVVLDDLELPNKPTPEVVVQVFRDATVRHMEQLRRQGKPGRAEKVQEALLRRASFHLAAPMIEAWLFADPSGPRNAKVPPERLPPSWDDARDPEDFLTQDADFLADDCAACVAWHALPAAKAKRFKPEWARAQRELHPKAFLAWLCRDAAEKKCSGYRETDGGATALQLLDWKAALRAPEHCAFLRALVEDLADGLGETLALPANGSVAPLTSHRERRDSPLLRNI